MKSCPRENKVSQSKPVGTVHFSECCGQMTLVLIRARLKAKAYAAV